MVPKLPERVEFIIEKLNSHGKRADIVGGCVRDFLLGREPYDFDVTTSATPDEMKEIFSDVRTVETGIKHGTLTVLLDGVPYEVTTYREDGEYIDHRHPEAVSFSDRIECDLSRRDFTMNSIAYNKKDGYTDLFSGMSDIENKLIRAVGNPGKRFDEDALRIMRAVRFAATLGFDIEKETARAATNKAGLLKSISGERIYAEWKKLIAGEHAYGVIKKYPEIMYEILGIYPKLPAKFAFDMASSEARTFALFAADKAPTESFLRFAERLRTDNKLLQCGMAVLENLSRPLETLEDVSLAFFDIGEEYTRTLIELRVTLGISDSKALSFAEEIIVKELPYKLSHLAIGGVTLKSLGFVGRDIGDALETLLKAVIYGKVKNTEGDLVEYIKSYTHMQ